MTKLIQFPSNFAWGVATAAYQIEGAWNKDGRGESIWDRFSHTPGKIENGDTGDIACDHYHRYAEDLALMARLGLRNYRFSISWPRVCPNGDGKLNQAGIDFYDRLVDEMLKNGIDPYATIYHWDLPQMLQDKGGWENRDTIKRFVEYSTTLVDALSDRVKCWTTINEPWVIAFMGNSTGQMAPGFKDHQKALAVGHNLLVAHGEAIRAIRQTHSGLDLGIVLSMSNSEALTQKQSDIDLAESDWRNDCEMFLRPLLTGQYPADAWSYHGGVAPDIRDRDMETIAQKLDFIGINYYFRHAYKDGEQIMTVPGSSHTYMGWEVCAPSFERMLVRINNEYTLPPVLITENGAAYRDVYNEKDDAVHDPQRLDYIDQHLRAVHGAIQQGVDIRGYFLWTFTDNFEWHKGFDQRFGMVHVDFASQKRTVKDSGLWYSKVVNSNTIAPQLAPV